MYNNAMLKEDFEDVENQPVKLSFIEFIEPYPINITSMILLDKEQFCCNEATD